MKISDFNKVLLQYNAIQYNANKIRKQRVQYEKANHVQSNTGTNEEIYNGFNISICS